MSDLSPLEVARELGLSRSAVFRLIEDGELVAYKLRGRLRVQLELLPEEAATGESPANVLNGEGQNRTGDTTIFSPAREE